jgi:hypothetical protein
MMPCSGTMLYQCLHHAEVTDPVVYDGDVNNPRVLTSGNKSTGGPVQTYFFYTRTVVLKIFWFVVHCKTYKNVLAHFGYKIKNKLIYLNYK